jgi:esterase/lipase
MFFNFLQINWLRHDFCFLPISYQIARLTVILFEMTRHPSRLFTHTYFPSLNKREHGRIYFFLGFGGTTTMYSPIILRLRKNGFSVVVFRFSVRKIMDLRIDTLPVSIHDICETVADYETKRTDKLQTISFGNSMGSVFAWHIAQRIRSIDKVVANTGYALISKMTFEWPKNKKWLEELSRDGHTPETLHKAIIDSEPITHFDKLKGKKVLLFMSRNDNVIDFAHAQIFKDALEHNGIEYTYVETENKTHGLVVAKNLVGKKVIDFLKS